MVAALLGCTAWAQTTKAKPKRARLPTWEKFPSDIFFKDAFRESLVGSRPARLGSERAMPKPIDNKPPSGNGHASGSGWSKIVSAETLQDEVKSLRISIEQHVITPGRFSSGDHKEVRREFSELAALFAVIAEFDGRVRWTKEAPTARDLFARAAMNAKVTSVQAFNEAMQRKFDLQELVRGGSLQIAESASGRASWENVCDRGPLMERFTLCYDEGIAQWTASVAEFRSKKARIKHETELLKMFSVILTKEGMEDAGDEDYESYCKQLTAAAEALLRAVEDNDPEAARRAASDVGKCCDQCHGDYRAK